MKAKVSDEGRPLRSEDEDDGRLIHARYKGLHLSVALSLDDTGIQGALEEDQEVGRPLDALSGRHAGEFEDKVHLKLRELVVREAQVELVEPEGFPIDLATIRAPMAVGTQGNQVVVLMRLRLRPGHDVVDVYFDVATRGDGAPMTSLDEDSSTDFSRYWRAPIPVSHGGEG